MRCDQDWMLYYKREIKIMKTILTIVVVIFIVCTGIVLSAGSPKVKCNYPGCEIHKGYIEVGDHGSFMNVNGELVPIHFKHAFDKAMAERFASLRK